MPRPLSLRDAIRATSRPEAYLSILSKGLLLIAGPLVLQILLVIVLFNAQRAEVEAERRALHSKEVLEQTAIVHRVVLESLARMRGVVIVGSPPVDLDPSVTSTDVIVEVDALRKLVADNLTQRQRADALRVAVAEFDSWIRTQQELVAAGRMEEVTQRIRAGEGVERLAAVRVELAVLHAEERRLDEERRIELAVARKSEQQFLIAALAASTVVACLVAWIFARGVAVRLAAVGRNASRLAQGLMPEPPLAGWDEIAALDEVLFDTGRRLADVSEAEARHKQELELRAADLARVNRELSQTARDNEMFVYSVSHDLRSPLVNLQGFSKELSRSCDDLRAALDGDAVPRDVRMRALDIVDQDFSESIRYIRTAVFRAAGIIDSLLRLSRAGRVEYRPQQVDLSQIVSVVVDAMRTTIVERGAELVVHQLGRVYGDPTAVEQIVANLINNAVSYLDPARPGFIEIGMVDRVPPVAIGPATDDWTQGAYRIMYVRDNGSGMPAAHVPKIFVAFQRLEPAKAEGEGIGLALVRRMVERHGGAIWVESSEGAGSSFYVALPTKAGLRALETAPEGATVES